MKQEFVFSLKGVRQILSFDYVLELLSFHYVNFCYYQITPYYDFLEVN
jgi:hypothetical protein